MIALALLARLVLAAVFLMSALTKVSAPGRFAEDVRQYRILPRPLAAVFAWSLPFLELSAALLLLGGFLITWASLAVVAMLLSFMLAVGIAMARCSPWRCSCSSSTAAPSLSPRWRRTSAAWATPWASPRPQPCFRSACSSRPCP